MGTQPVERELRIRGQRWIKGRLEPFCEYCGEIEHEDIGRPRKDGKPVRFTHLTMQRDGTRTCQRCGPIHNHKHQTGIRTMSEWKIDGILDEILGDL